MDIERTPKSGHEDTSDSRLTPLGRRHTPTARMSERKRSLFDKKFTSLALIMDDDVDLGPMSPLQYSSSPTEDLLPFDRNAKQTDFTNLFPGSSLKPALYLSPSNSSINSPSQFPAGKSMLVVEESNSTAISVQSATIGVNPPPTATAASEEKESSTSRTVQEKTPSERMINCQELRVSFKKSLILGDMFTEEQRGLKNQKRSYSTSVLTEKNSSDSTSPQEKMQKLDAVDASRARTSLSFEGALIPTKRFYSSGKENDENKEPRKRYSLPLLPSRDRKKSTTTSTRHRDSSGVMRKGCSHKIKKPVRVASKETLRKKVELAVLEDHHQQHNKEKEKMSIDEAQTTRIHEILKNIKNPLEMSRPLFFHEKWDKFQFTDEEEEEEVGEGEKAAKKKFFKSGGTTGTKSYKLTNSVVATVEGGKITLPKFPTAAQQQHGVMKSPDVNKSQEPSEFSMVEEEFGSEEFDEVRGIISKLTSDDEMDAFRQRLPYQTTDPEVAQKQSELLEMLINHQLCNEENFKIFIAEPELHKEEMNRIMDSLVGVEEEEKHSGLFPIFYQQNHRHQQSSSKRKLVALGEEKTACSRKVWKRIGDAQLQIDAGQKRFGASYCAECDLLYSVHEPEDELMHERFHAALSVLKFPGWKTETVVRELPQWGVDGRVVAVPWNEHRSKVLRVNVVLQVINKEMGCPDIEWRSKTIVYLAVAQNTILGVCVAESKYEANRLVTEGGIDFFSEENYPVWCGITRIWVAAPYRNQGVASELVNAVRMHYTVGRSLGVEEVAFQSPTEAGKLLAQKLTGRRDFLVYP